MSDDNPHKLVARYRKARKIADKLAPADIPTEALEYGTLAVRTLAAQLAETNVPSDTTWALVVELITEKRTAWKTTLPTSTTEPTTPPLTPVTSLPIPSRHTSS